MSCIRVLCDCPAYAPSTLFEGLIKEHNLETCCVINLVNLREALKVASLELSKWDIDGPLAHTKRANIVKGLDMVVKKFAEFNL